MRLFYIRLFYILLIAALALIPLGARAEDEAPADTGGVQGAAPGDQGDTADDEQADTSEEEPPPPDYALEPTVNTWLGYDFVDFEGAKRGAGEFMYPHSSLVGGYLIHFDPLPNRLDTELTWNNPNDYEAEFAYAYKDILKLNYIGWSLWHNLDHIKPQAAVIDDHNPGTDYHVTVRDNKLFLRLKLPELPYHLFVDYRHYEKEGIVQARWYEASAPVRIKGTKERDIDWVTDRYLVGANGHFGPVEVEYSHLIKEFSPHKDVALADTLVGVPNQLHSVVPRLETNADTVKVHTDLTGSIVGAATFVNGERDNDYSGAEVQYRRAFGDMTFIPFDDVTVAVRYRYKELLESVPQVFGTSVKPVVPGIPTDPIETHSNHAEVVVRYSPMTNLGLKAQYSFDNVKRYRAEDWSEPAIFPFQEIPSVQNIHTVKIGVNARPVRDLNMEGNIEYAYCADPAYPIDPMNSYKGEAHADWMVLPTVSAGAHYRYAQEQNNAANMNSRYDNPGAQVMWSPAAKKYFSAAYDYFRNRNVRDVELTLGDSSNTPFPVQRVPYRDTSHVYAVSGGYTLPIPLTFEAEFRQSWSKGMFRTNVDTAGATTSGIGELADLRVRETGGSVSARYDFPKGWSSSASYSINNYVYFHSAPENGPQDGTAHSIMLIVSKKWY